MLGPQDGPMNYASQIPYYMDQSVPNMYGATGFGAAPGMREKPLVTFVRGQRRRMNIVSMGLAVGIPWVLFMTVFAVLSFTLHYTQPVLAYCIVGVGLVVVIVAGSLAADAAQKKTSHDMRREPTWYIFMFLSCLLAWTLGVMCGNSNFNNNFQPFYDIMNLNTYPAVDPIRMRGQQLMDAGRIIFTEGSHLDLRRSMGFKNSQLYCVAPITRTNPDQDESGIPAIYDFWAVGTNCCSGNAADYHCGQFNNGHAHAGLRLMNDGQRPFYRLAVQQAEAAYNITAAHPLFFTWMQDPVGFVNNYRDSGFKMFLLGTFSFFALQFFLVATAAIAFSRLGQS